MTDPLHRPFHQRFPEEVEEPQKKEDSKEPASKPSSWAPLLRYLGECGHPVELALIAIFLSVFILFNLSSRIFVQKWLDAGDGLEEERRQNSSYQNTTNTDQDLRGFINDNPDLGTYQLIYGLILLAMLLTGFLKVERSADNDNPNRPIVGRLHITEDAQWISEGSQEDVDGDHGESNVIL